MLFLVSQRRSGYCSKFSIGYPDTVPRFPKAIRILLLASQRRSGYYPSFPKEIREILFSIEKFKIYS